MSDYADRVARGVLWLDHMHDGWREKIDLSKFDISSPYRCILGQIFGSFWAGQGLLLHGQTCDMGFDAYGDEYYGFSDLQEIYAYLENEWRKVLAA